MFLSKVVLYFYCFLTLLAFINGTQLDFLDCVPGLVLMWIAACVFLAGSRGKSHYTKPGLSRALFTMESSSLFNLLLVCLLSVLWPEYVQFYTGMTVREAISNYLSGSSTYMLYQAYFAERGLMLFQVEKVPFVLLGGVMKFFFIVVTLRSICFQRKVHWLNLAVVGCFCANYAILAMARGTFFEYFEILCLLFFAILLRSFRINGVVRVSKKTMVVAGVLLFFATSFFIYNMSQRFADGAMRIGNPVEKLDSDPSSFLAQYLPPLADGTTALAGYFSFGLYFVSLCFYTIWMTDVSAMFSTMLPMGFESLYAGVSTHRELIERHTYCGASWTPDVIVYIEKIGLPLALFVVFLIGSFGRRLSSSAQLRSLPSAVLLYYVFIFMISLPVGNFISSSSSNIIALCLALLVYFFPRLLLWLNVE